MMIVVIVMCVMGVMVVEGVVEMVEDVVIVRFLVRSKVVAIRFRRTYCLDVIVVMVVVVCVIVCYLCVNSICFF